MFLALWHYLRGYVIIRVSGFSVERFVNLAALRGIYIWDIKPNKNAVVMRVSPQGFKGLKECARKTKCHYKIMDRRGLPFLIDRCKHRKVYTAGVFFFVAVLYVLSSFIWTVTVTGNDRIPTQDIITFCSEQGLAAGKLKMTTDTKKVTDRLILKFEDISWVAISTKGTKVTITIVETIPKTEIVDRETPCSIIADKACIIESISVSAGTPLVKAKDVVEKGDVLVSGTLTIKDMDTEIGRKYVRSVADIKGRCVYTIENSMPLTYINKVKTGNITTDNSIVLGDYVLDFVAPRVKFQLYDKKEKEIKEFKIGDYVLPLKILCTEYEEYTEDEKNRTEEEAKAEINGLLLKTKQDMELGGAQIIGEETEFLLNNNILTSTTTLTVIENIGKEKSIEIEKEKGEAQTDE